MTPKRTLLGVLALVGYMGISHADGLHLPVAANVVIPLLRSYSPKDSSEKAVSADMVKLLGEHGVEQSHGPGGEMSEQYYALDDQTMIHISFFKNKLQAITRQSRSAQFLETLYPASSH